MKYSWCSQTFLCVKSCVVCVVVRQCMLPPDLGHNCHPEEIIPIPRFCLCNRRYQVNLIVKPVCKLSIGLGPFVCRSGHCAVVVLLALFSGLVIVVKIHCWLKMLRILEFVLCWLCVLIYRFQVAGRIAAMLSLFLVLLFIYVWVTTDAVYHERQMRSNKHTSTLRNLINN